MGPRIRALGVNSTLNAMGLVVPGVVGLIATPLLVRGLGAADFAVFSLALVGLAYAPLSDLGMGRVVTMLVARGGDLRQGISESGVVWTALLGAVLLGCTLTLAVLGVVRGTGLVGALLPPERAAEAVWALSAVALSLPFMTSLSVARGALEGLQRFAFLNAVRSVGNTLVIGVPAVMTMAGSGLEDAIVVLLTLRCALTLVYFVGLLLLRPQVRRPALAPGVIRVLLHSGSGMATTAALGPILVLADRFAVGYVTDAETMGWYSALSDMALWLRVPASSVAVAVFPMIAGQAGWDRQAAVATLVLARRAVSIALFLLGTMAVAALPLATGVILGPGTWMGQWLVLGILVMGSVSLFHGYVPIASLEGSGRAWTAARVQLVQIVPLVALYFVAARHLGVAGVAAVWALRAVSEASLYDRLAMGMNGPCTASGAARHRVTVRAHALAFGLWAGVGLAWTGDTLVQGVVNIALAGTVSAAVSLRVGLAPAERAALGAWLRELLGRSAP